MSACQRSGPWPHAAQLLVAFFLGAASTATAIRLQSARPRPLESLKDLPVVDHSNHRIPPVSISAKPALVRVEEWEADEVVVSAKPAAPDPPKSRGKSPPSATININRATREELTQLPGVGPTLAGRIIAERDNAPFQTVDELTRVPGIGAKTLARVRPYIRVDGD